MTDSQLSCSAGSESENYFEIGFAGYLDGLTTQQIARRHYYPPHDDHWELVRGWNAAEKLDRETRPS